MVEVENERSAADRFGSSVKVKEVTGCSQESLVSLALPTAEGEEREESGQYNTPACSSVKR